MLRLKTLGSLQLDYSMVTCLFLKCHIQCQTVTEAVLIVKLCVTFRVHVQAVGFTAVVGSHVMVADGDVKGVTASDVVTQRFPVHRDQTSPGLSDLQPLRSPHRFCRETEEHTGGDGR